MPNSGIAEVYFIAAMMILILIICTVAVYFFFKTFYKEKKAKVEAQKRKSEQIQNPKSKIQN